MTAVAHLALLWVMIKVFDLGRFKIREEQEEEEQEEDSFFA